MGKAWLRSGDKALRDENGNFPDHTAAIKKMFAALREQGVEKLAAAGHRIVHGGPKFIPERFKGCAAGMLGRRHLRRAGC